MKKKFCASSIVRQMDEAVSNYNANHKKVITSDTVVHLASVILTTPHGISGKNPDSRHATRKVPFLCFMRNASHNKTVIVGLESGKTEIVSNHALVIKHKDMDTFSMKGTRYKLKDCVNGLPRFVVAHADSRSGNGRTGKID